MASAVNAGTSHEGIRKGKLKIMNTENKETNVEYFFCVKNVRLSKGMQEDYKNGKHTTFRQSLTPDQSVELGKLLIAAGMHSIRWEHQQKPSSKIRSKLEPIKEVLLTTHCCGSITVLGR